MARFDDKRQVWRISAEAGYSATRKRKRLVRTFHAPHTRAGEREAILAEMRLRVEAADAREREWPGQDTTATFGDVSHGWLDRNRNRWSPKTVREVDYALRRYIVPTLGKTRLVDITPVQIENLYARWEGTYSPSCIRRWHGIIRAIFSDAERLEILVSRNPMTRVRAGGGPAEEIHIPSAADVRAAIDSAKRSPAAQTLFELAAATGARRGSLLALRWRDIDLEGGTLTFTNAVAIGPDGRQVLKGTKANRPYAIAILGPALVALREHYARSARGALALGHGRMSELFVFSRDGGKTPFHVNSASHAWQRACQRAELPNGIRLHDLRHFAATRMLEKGVPIRVVAERLGCTEQNVMRTYSHHVPSSEDLRAAQVLADVMKI